MWTSEPVRFSSESTDVDATYVEIPACVRFGEMEGEFSADAIERELLSLESLPGIVIISLKNVKYVSEHGLNKLLMFSRHRNGRVRLTDVGKDVAEKLRRTRIDSILKTWERSD